MSDKWTKDDQAWFLDLLWERGENPELTDLKFCQKIIERFSINQPAEHKNICSSGAPITDMPCHICGAVNKEPRLAPLDSKELKFMANDYWHTEVFAGATHEEFDLTGYVNAICAKFAQPKEVKVSEVDELTVNTLKETVGYLLTKQRQLVTTNKAQAKMFEDRAFAIEAILNFLNARGK